MHIILSRKVFLSTPNRSQRLSPGHCALTWQNLSHCHHCLVALPGNFVHGSSVQLFWNRHVVNKPGLQNVGRLDVTMKDLHCCTSSEKKKTSLSWCLRVSPRSMHFALGVWWCKCDRPQAASYATQIRSRHGKACHLGFLPHERDDAFRGNSWETETPNCEDSPPPKGTQAGKSWL